MGDGKPMQLSAIGQCPREQSVLGEADSMSACAPQVSGVRWSELEATVAATVPVSQ